MYRVMSKILIGLFFCLLASSLSAEETSYTLAVYKSSVTKTDTDSMKIKGWANRKEPIVNTRLLTAPNATTYYTLEITPQNESENNYVDSLLSAGKALLIQKSVIHDNGEVSRSMPKFPNDWWLEKDTAEGPAKK